MPEESGVCYVYGRYSSLETLERIAEQADKEFFQRTGADPAYY